MKVCAYEECENKFTAKTHNQKYCRDECTRLATNKRIMERYYEKRDIRQGTTKRSCAVSDCDTVLSRYNDKDVCSVHSDGNTLKTRETLRALVAGWA